MNMMPRWGKAKSSSQNNGTNGANATSDEGGNPLVNNVFNLKDYVAKKGTTLLYGNGWLLFHKKETQIKAMMEILNANGMDGLLNSNEYHLSTRIEGNQIWMVQPNPLGQVRITLADMNYIDNSRIETAPNGDIIAGWITWTNIIGKTHLQVQQIFYPTHMDTIIKDINNDYKEVNIGFYNNLVPVEYQLLDFWEYDKIPLKMFVNYATIGASSVGDGIGVRQLQFLMDKSYSSEYDEMLYNATRIIQHSTMSSANNTKKGIISKIFINTGQKTQDGANPLQIIQGDQKFSEFDNNQNNILDQYVIGSLYSIKDRTSGQQTQMEVAFDGKDDIQTTRIKKIQRQKDIRDILDIVIMVNNQQDANTTLSEGFSIEINSFISFDEQQKTEQIRVMKELGIPIDLDWALKHFYKTDNVEALKQKNDFIEFDNKPQVEEEEEVEESEVENG